MKRFAIGALVILLLAGCTGQGALDLFQQQNPGVAVGRVDEDGDGLPDVYVILDTTGQPVLGADGKPSEVPGSRQDFNRAKADDSLLSSELSLWGEVIPGGAVLTLIAGLVGRWKPNQRYKLYRDRFTETIASVKTYRDSLAPEARAEMTANFGRVSADTRDAINDIKVALEKLQADAPA